MVLLQDRLEEAARIDRDHPGELPFQQPVSWRVDEVLKERPRQVAGDRDRGAGGDDADGDPAAQPVGERDEGEHGEHDAAVRQKAERHERDRDDPAE